MKEDVMAITAASREATAKLGCLDDAILSMTREQQVALHQFKNRCLAALNRLYSVVEEDKANPIVIGLLPTLIDG
jgi:hypothetical protein